jgi:(S)-citramalyl-CoA lyase
MEADIAALPLAECTGLVLPKVSGVADLEACREVLAAGGGRPDLPLIPVIESAAGVLHAAEIAVVPDVGLLALGRFDLAADLGIEPELDTPSMSHARGAIVLASRAANLQPPLDSPWLRVQDVTGLLQAAQKARRDGFGGMMVIHPSHVKTVHDVFRPSSKEVLVARSLISDAIAAGEAGHGAFVRDGEMIDEAILRRARGILEQGRSDESI